MPDNYRRLKARFGKFGYIRGAFGDYIPDVTPIVGRDAYIPGTYNPVDYSAYWDPALRAVDYTDNRVGIYGLDTLTSEIEGNGSAATYPTNGQVIANTMFWCRVSATGQDQTYVNCFIKGSYLEAAACFTSGSNGARIHLLDCTISPMAPQTSTQGAKVASGFVHFERCDIYGCIDGVAPSNTDSWAKFTQCAFHDQVLISPDFGAIGGIKDNMGHVDAAMQTAGGSRMEFIGCGISAFYDTTQYCGNMAPVYWGTPSGTPPLPPYHGTGNKYWPKLQTTSGIMMSPNNPANNADLIKQFRFTKGFIDGGAYGINAGSHITTSDFTVADSFIGQDYRDHTDRKFIIAYDALKPQMTFTNVRTLVYDTASISARRPRGLSLTTGVAITDPNSMVAKGD